MGLQDIRYTVIEPLHHAVGSWGSWGSWGSGLGQPVLNPQLLAQSFELMVAAWLALPASKQAIRELLAVVGHKLDDSERTCLVQCLQEGMRTGGCLVGLQLHEHPGGRPVNSHEQIAPAALVLHLGQELHVHVQVARLVALFLCKAISMAWLPDFIAETLSTPAGLLWP